MVSSWVENLKGRVPLGMGPPRVGPILHPYVPAALPLPFGAAGRISIESWLKQRARSRGS
jgi:hypothetical protein